ncbi:MULTISPECIES: transporter suffix domain-containing protein [unclassified Coleofasciculus]|uniref:transporter suffix domain-containing protein n=1 Tax=Cyanophyceae TaxID=3028117 RepID=UPI0016877D74|nr:MULTISPECIES: transporter suffix domain-containing protein [unclassified Coleofasciculus]MBD1838559.1 transporter suffix domain-containing protein [Coleofasciculus sp. FACHB-501]MBD1889824.1 transporter suffix domain-containing protein [Coleofasciculus sp. FACHB-SPT9]
MQKLGIFLIVFSFLPWVAILLVVPLLPLAIAQKAILVPILAVVGEVAFWVGLVLVGKEAATKYRAYLNPGAIWRKVKKLIRPKKRSN